MILDQIAYLLLALFFGIIFGAIGFWLYHKSKLGSYDVIAQGILYKAELEVASMKKNHELSLKQSQIEQQKELELNWQGERKKLHREEERIQQREDKLETRLQIIEKKQQELEKKESTLHAIQTQLNQEKLRQEQKEAQLISELENISQISAGQAKEILMERLTEDVKNEAAILVRRIRRDAEENADKEARTILATAINRLAVHCVSETTVNTVAIPEDMKGRIIGREGRNIRTLEKETGVNFVIDDTPGAIVLSGFDPIRLQIAKSTLQDLISDGRVYPTRIEEAVEKARSDIHKQIKQFGEDAALRAGIMSLHPEIITLLGKLNFRFSFGQNVLEHSLEVSHLMGLIAAELGLDVRMAKRIGLLHDMGKAVTHEIEGSHAVIGHDLALKYGETKEVANGIGCHHGEMKAMTIEGSFCSAADAISASRLGARCEAVEEYLKRLKKLEEIAMEAPGVEMAHAMQAGREVRVIVRPDQVDDDGVVNLARNLTKRIEGELKYPGKIKVLVIREKRIIEYAT